MEKLYHDYSYGLISYSEFCEAVREYQLWDGAKEQEDYHKGE